MVPPQPLNSSTYLYSMNLSIWTIGKSHESYIKEGVNEFTKRIGRYYKIEWNIIPVPKNAGMMSEMDLRKKEGELILSLLKKDDHLVTLDERGKQFTSIEFSDLIVKCGNESVKHMIFLIGGAFGIDKPVLQSANTVMSLSKLTFPHQLVRLILAEQLYRACSIAKGEKYHHGGERG